MPIHVASHALHSLCSDAIFEAADVLKVDYGNVATNIETVAVTMAGLDERFDPTLMHGFLQESHVFTNLFPKRRIEETNIVIRSIAEACHIAAFREEHGIVVRAGVGCSVFGRNGEARHLANAWGFLPGDLGGGYHIGQQVLHKLTRSYDYRATPEEHLFAKRAYNLMEEHNAPDIFDRYRRKLIPDRHLIMLEIYGLSQAAFALAKAHQCPVAMDILDQSSQELVEGIHAVYQRVCFDQESVPITYQGSLLENHKAYTKQLFRKARQSFPLLQLHCPDPAWHRRSGTCLLALSPPRENAPFRSNSACEHFLSFAQDREDEFAVPGMDIWEDYNR